MELMKALQERRAVRHYTSEPVGDENIRALLDAAVLAPSAMNGQPWVFCVIEDKVKLEHWSDQAKQLLLEGEKNPKLEQYAARLRDPSFNVFYDAPALIVIGVEQRGRYAAADCWLAAENLMLAATARKLGSCCIGFALELLNTQTVKEELRIPARGEAIAPIIVGHPRELAPRIPRAEPKILTWLH